MPQSTDEIKKRQKKEEIDYLETSLKTPAEDFKTIQNIEDKKRKKIFKKITNSTDSMVVYDEVTVNDWASTNNNTGNKIKHIYLTYKFTSMI